MTQPCYKLTDNSNDCFACRWRRRWQWGLGSSRTHDAADLSTAPVDIEQPAVANNDAGASSSASHSALQGIGPGSAELSSTPVNFPGMHYSRAAAGEASDVSSQMLYWT